MSATDRLDWRKSPAHLALLAVFLEPSPPDPGNTALPWETVLGEPPQQAVERFLHDKALAPCGTTQILLHELPKLTAEKLRELLKDKGLPVSDSISEMVARLTQKSAPELLLVVPRPYRYLLICTDDGRRLAESFKQEGAKSLRNTDAAWREAWKKILLWLLAGGLVTDILGSAAYDLLKQLFPDEEIPAPRPPLPVQLPGETPAPQPIPEAPDFSEPEKTSAPEPNRPPGRLRRSFEPELVRVPAGYFWMGSDDGDKQAWADEKPKHRLYLPEYWIGRYPVTVAQFEAFVRATDYLTADERARSDYTWRQPHGKGSSLTGKREHPVVRVDWHAALAYCRWLSERTGRSCCLPSEAEWEKAARGSDGRIYPWGDDWRADFCNTSEKGPGDTTPVGAYSPRGDSPYGCADMAGNVWEWTRSLDQDYPYDPHDGREDLDAQGPRVLRGGSFSHNRRYARCALRNGDYPDDRSNNIGFRVVVSP